MGLSTATRSALSFARPLNNKVNFFKNSLRSYSSPVLTGHPSAATYVRKGVQVAEALPVEETAIADAFNRSVIIHENGSPLSSLAFVFKAGSRFETPESFGASHLWKNAIVRNSEIKPLNIVHTVRDAELRGATLWTAHSREEVIIGTDFLRDDLPDAIFSLLTHVSNSQFLPYEFYEAGNHTINETASALSDPLNVVFDKLHAVAFRNGLGNHLFASEGALNHLDREKLFSYASKFFVPAHTAIVGLGVNARDFTSIFEDFVSSAPLNKTSGIPSFEKSKYYGGEFRLDRGPGSSPIVAYTLPSVSFSDSLYPAHLVLRGLLDGEKHSVWGTDGGVSSLLSKVNTPNTQAVGIEASYSDSGLIGFLVTGKESEIESVTKGAIATLKKIASSGVSDADLARAKSIALVELEKSKLSRQGLIQEIGRRATTSGNYSSVLGLSSSIEKVTAADIKKLLSQAIKSEASVVVSGNTTVLPHASDLA